ncbi:exosortase/archaeosortase family protein [bacterium]|nr:exosortase/archaeosortase family protein [bacterium]
MPKIAEENVLLEGTVKSSSYRKLIKKLYVNTSVVIGAKIGFIVLLLVVIYYPTAGWMWTRWFWADSYYSHGPLIPLVSGVLIWLKRRELAEAQISYSKPGIFILSAGLFLHLLSALVFIQSISGFSLPIVMIGLVLYLFGWEITRIVLFPLGFLFFIAPAPLQFIAATTLKMKLFAAHISAIAVQLLGIPMVREGSIVHLSNTTITVGDPCSGLRSLISLTALGVLYAYLAQSSYPKRVALVLASIPIAIIANIIRVIGVIVVANSYGNRIVTDGLVHDAFGFSVFVIALAGLILTGRILGCQILKKDT